MIAEGRAPASTVTLALYFLSGNFFVVEHQPLLLRVILVAWRFFRWTPRSESEPRPHEHTGRRPGKAHAPAEM
jgi:hypothetical protein